MPIPSDGTTLAPEKLQISHCPVKELCYSLEIYPVIAKSTNYSAYEQMAQGSIYSKMALSFSLRCLVLLRYMGFNYIPLRW
jgi:hypothetical protein